MKKGLKNLIIFFIPCCIFFLIFVIILINSNKNNEIMNKQTEIESKVNNFDSMKIYQSCVQEENIFCSTYISPNSIIDLSDINVVYDKSDLVLVGTVKEKKQGVMINGCEYAVLPGVMEIENVIKGEYQYESIDFFVNGGYCTVSEYIEAIINTHPEIIEKTGMSNLTDDEKKNKYIIFNYEYGKNFEEGQKYILMLKKIEDKYFCISSTGFIDIPTDVSISDFSDIINMAK